MGNKECFLCEKVIDEDELHDHFVSNHMDEIIQHMKDEHIRDMTSEMSWECPYVDDQEPEEENNAK